MYHLFQMADSRPHTTLNMLTKETLPSFNITYGMYIYFLSFSYRQLLQNIMFENYQKDLKSERAFSLIFIVIFCKTIDNSTFAVSEMLSCYF